MNFASTSSDQAVVIEPNARARAVVLLVDDDIAGLMMAEGPLLDAGYEVVQATDGLEAVAKFNTYLPDIVIMDAVMPNMDGFEAIAEIRKTDIGAHVPILMITGLDDLDSITKAYEEGATDFLAKPINFFILPHRVQYMLRSKATSDELRASQARLDNAQRIAKLGHWEWAVASNTANWSQEVARLFGIESGLREGPMETLFSKIDSTQSEEIRWEAEQAVKNAQPISLEFNIKGQRVNDILIVRFESVPKLDQDGNCTHMMGTVQDVTESANAQKQVHDLAYFDLITGLPNRAQLRENLSLTLKMAERQDNQFALLFLDLDHFKQVNDTLGHDAGDDLLVQVSNRLSTVLRNSDTLSRPVESNNSDESESSKDTVARIGGDEFVIILGEMHTPEDAARVAERIAKSISEPYNIADVEIAVTTTIGISIYPTDGRDADTLMKHADVAMYHAKENGRNGFQFYSKRIHEHALTRFSMEKELKIAVEQNQLSLLFQPKIDVVTGRTIGVEALTRWCHPELGEISPAKFIPIAEETGLILPLGAWVLKEATRQVMRWKKNDIGEFSVAVNCSPVQFTRGNMTSDIQTALDNSAIDPSLLEIELTESLFLNNIENGIQILNNIKKLGVQIAIDDFGTGVSSLSYLKRLPVDKLKIDRAFVQDVHIDKGDQAIVSALVTLGHNLGMSVVAEGVESSEQFAVLKELRCNEAQGYFLSYPLSSDEFERWLTEQDDSRKQAG